PQALFSDSGAEQEAGQDALGQQSTGQAGSVTEKADAPAAWNFLLISLQNRGDIDAVSAQLSEAGYTNQQGYRVRNWSSSVGGNAQLAWFLQLLFNIGLLFVSFGAVIIAANALLLSILERTGEIGTLRAMGALRSRIAALIFIETLLVVFGSALLGILLGWLGVARLNRAALVIDNPYIKILFGGDPIQGKMDYHIIFTHLTAALVLTILSMLYPLKRALGIRPVEAMAE
ncbi:MAG: FtsX-like permease family protein, partial [Spirochaetaceae bacterium]|nr:FtsX-like permease family protein [Spirochaetaceae bacterium]MCF7938734.1 FtsX-like permease family protein [Spirochaetales bacterium]